MILVDTSVWVDHLRTGIEQLRALLLEGQVTVHPFVIGELACGNLRDRERILGLMASLPAVLVAEHQDVMRLLDRRRLHGRSLGWVDAHLLASALLAGCGFWTVDEVLRRAAQYPGIPR